MRGAQVAVLVPFLGAVDAATFAAKRVFSDADCTTAVSWDLAGITDECMPEGSTDIYAKFTCHNSSIAKRTFYTNKDCSTVKTDVEANYFNLIDCVEDDGKYVKYYCAAEIANVAQSKRYSDNACENHTDTHLFLLGCENDEEGENNVSRKFSTDGKNLSYGEHVNHSCADPNPTLKSFECDKCLEDENGHFVLSVPGCGLLLASTRKSGASSFSVLIAVFTAAIGTRI